MNPKMIVRWLLGIPRPKLSAEEALRIARTECTKRGISIVGDYLVVEQLKNWLIWIDKNRKGSPMVLVDQQTGEIVKFNQLPR